MANGKSEPLKPQLRKIHLTLPMIAERLQGLANRLTEKADEEIVFELTALSVHVAAHAPSGYPPYPKPCGICDGVIQSQDDLDWHGYGNCRDIPEIVMADLNIAELLRDLQGHIAGELGERLEKVVASLSKPGSVASQEAVCPACGSGDRERAITQLNSLPLSVCPHKWHKASQEAANFVSDNLYPGPSCTLCGGAMQPTGYKCLSCGSTLQPSEAGTPAKE